MGPINGDSSIAPITTAGDAFAIHAVAEARRERSPDGDAARRLAHDPQMAPSTLAVHIARRRP
jgi:hypothetical protein